MSRPTVIIAHERLAVREIVGHVLHAEGFDPTPAKDIAGARRLLESARWDGLVLDVALPGMLAFELCDEVLALRERGLGARATVLVASVYRSTSYKRRPQRLYGADDYVEIHHLGDALPGKLRRLLGETEPTAAEHLEAGEALRRLGDRRSDTRSMSDLAKLVVADVVLYNGDRLLAATDVAAAEHALAHDLAAARELYAHLGGVAERGDPIRIAFFELMRAMGRGGATP